MIAKRDLVVSKRELRELFNLPEGIEIMAVRVNKSYGEEDFEFLLASAGEVEDVTVVNYDSNIIRRLTLDGLKEINFRNIAAENLPDGVSIIYNDTELEQDNDNLNTTYITFNINNPKDNSEQLVNEIIKGLKRINNTKKV